MVQQVIFSDSPVLAGGTQEYRLTVDASLWLTGIYAWNATNSNTILAGVNPKPDPATHALWERMILKQKVLHSDELFIWEGTKKVEPGNELFIFFQYGGTTNQLYFCFVGEYIR